MGLDYSGTPKQPFRRDLTDTINRLRQNKVELLDEEPENRDDALFNDIARVFIKGDKLQKGLGEMNPAGFIPVEQESDVIFSIQRVDPTLSTDRITFGLFKEACEFIAAQGQNIDEQFMLNLTEVDVNSINRKIVTHTKGQTNESDDFLSQFLTALSPFAGIMIMGFLNDLASLNSPKVGVPDGTNSGQQVPLWHAQGLGVGISMLIELGLGVAAFMATTGEDTNSLKPEIRSRIDELSKDPAQRKQLLEEAGYDYEALKKNKKFDDYTAIKDYSIQYISRQNNNLNYDHWIAWVNVNDNQSLLRGALAMAPTYSQKWRRFYDTNDVESFENVADQNVIDDPEQVLIDGAIAGMRSYFSTLWSISNDHYDQTHLVYTMQLDARFMCCIIWFLGPLDIKSLEGISDILRLLSFDVKLNIPDMISFITAGAASNLLNMISVYINKVIDGIYNNIMDKLFSIPRNDWEVAIKYCIGIQVLFNIIEKAFVKVISTINEIIDHLEHTLRIKLQAKSHAYIQVSAERRFLTTLAALVDAIAAKLEFAQTHCNFPNETDPQKINDLAAEAAVDFVTNEVAELYPTLDLPEDVRRKFFSGIPGFTTDNLGIEIPGSDSVGQQADLEREDQIFECGDGARALEGLAIGKKIADIMRGTV
ncbi:MAG: hypothetical protein ACXABY_16895 [Candidatus Thorarchaeota archaeon]|jgi:hypothetical protein